MDKGEVVGGDVDMDKGDVVYRWVEEGIRLLVESVVWDRRG